MPGGQGTDSTTGGNTVALDPADLHTSATRLAMATDDASPQLAAATTGDCTDGFPGTSATAYSALMTQWQDADGALLNRLNALASRLHSVAREYAAADEAHAAQLKGAAHSRTAGPTPSVLNL